MKSLKKSIQVTDLIAMHKNKFWNPEAELLIDAGAFIHGIEFASGKEAIVIGKPSSHYFKAALRKNRS